MVVRRLNRIELDGSLRVTEDRLKRFEDEFPHIPQGTLKFIAVESWYVNIIIGELINRWEIFEANKKQILENSSEESYLNGLLWLNLRALIAAAAEASMLMKPPSPRIFPEETRPQFRLRKKVSQLRGKAILSLTKTPDDAAFLDRSLRNRFAHFDESFDSWLVQSERRNMVNRIIVGKTRVLGINENEIFESFDPNNWIFKYRGVSFELLPIELSLSVSAANAAMVSKKLWKMMPD